MIYRLIFRAHWHIQSTEGVINMEATSLPITVHNWSITTSENITTSLTAEELPIGENHRELTFFIVCICVVILFIGVVGNTLVIVVFGSKWSVIKTYEVYMINLAAADLIATIIYPSKYLHQTMGGSFRHVGVSGCTAIEFLGTSSVAVSSFTLVVISFDR